MLKSLEDATVQRSIIFCNTIQQCREVENILNRADRQEKLRRVLPYHGAIDATMRESNIAEFSRRLLKVPVVLVCTDRASRGLDFDSAPVEHVILYDFPQEPSEYVRRVGRTGRAGRSGKATVLVHGIVHKILYFFKKKLNNPLALRETSWDSQESNWGLRRGQEN